MMGNGGTPGATSQPSGPGSTPGGGIPTSAGAGGGIPVSDSAFKTVPSGGGGGLPPISTCLKDAGSFMPGGLPAPPPHPHHPAMHHQPAMHHPTASTAQYHPHTHHHHPHTQEPPQMHPGGFKDLGYMGSSGGQMSGMGGMGGMGGAAAPHPAFPVSVPPWLQQTPAYGLAHLQHLLANDKGLGVTPCLSDPLAKAALMDLGRMHAQYPIGKKLFGCPQCRYITDRKNNLKRHVATMHQECDKVLECCGIAFKNKASLRDHVLIFHSNGYMCRFCGRNFCRKALLKRHLTVHSGQKDYICSLCDYATSHKSNLERHKKVHERQGSEDGSIDNQEASSSSDHPRSLPQQHLSSGKPQHHQQHHQQQQHQQHSPNKYGVSSTLHGDLSAGMDHVMDNRVSTSHHHPHQQQPHHPHPQHHQGLHGYLGNPLNDTGSSTPSSSATSPVGGLDCLKLGRPPPPHHGLPGLGCLPASLSHHHLHQQQQHPHHMRDVGHKPHELSLQQSDDTDLDSSDILDPDLGLGSIDVVGVDMSDQTPSLIDVVHLHDWSTKWRAENRHHSS